MCTAVIRLGIVSVGGSLAESEVSIEGRVFIKKLREYLLL
jgi:hypothetical protein